MFDCSSMCHCIVVGRHRHRNYVATKLVGSYAGNV